MKESRAMDMQRRLESARREPCLLCGARADFLGVWTLSSAHRKLPEHLEGSDHLHTLCRRCIDSPNASHLIEQRILERIAARN